VDWSKTVSLFEDFYMVPFLPPEWAAYAGTAGEIVLPVLLVFGLGGRFAALGLSVVNAVATLSVLNNPDLGGPAALQEHAFWASLLLGLVLWGPGRLSVDHFLTPRLQRWLGIAPTKNQAG
jgi:putative oxidoreductase